MLLQQVEKLIAAILKEEKLDINFDLNSVVTYPPRIDMGDVSSNICFRLAKKQKKSPMTLAEELLTNIKGILDNYPEIEKVEAVNGYLNFWFNKKLTFEWILTTVINEKANFGAKSTHSRKIVVEHTSINPCKPLHIGSLRNSVIGDVVARLYRKCGWQVEVQNYLDDLGKQVATLVWGFLNSVHLTVPRAKDMKYDVWLGLVYSAANQCITENPEKSSSVDALMTDIKKDSTLFSYSRKFAEACVRSNLETTWNVGITYDLLVWESDIGLSSLWEEVKAILEAKKPAFEWVDEGELKGCFVAHLKQVSGFKGMKNPDKVLIRSNGVPTYVAHDLAFQMWKFGIIKDPLMYRDETIQLGNNNRKTVLQSTTREDIAVVKKRNSKTG